MFDYGGSTIDKSVQNIGNSFMHTSLHAAYNVSGRGSLQRLNILDHRNIIRIWFSKYFCTSSSITNGSMQNCKCLVFFIKLNILNYSKSILPSIRNFTKLTLKGIFSINSIIFSHSSVSNKINQWYEA